MRDSPRMLIAGCNVSVLDDLQLRPQPGVSRNCRRVRIASHQPPDAHQRRCHRGAGDGAETALLPPQGHTAHVVAALLLQLPHLVRQSNN